MNDNELEQHAKQALDRSAQEISPDVRQSLYEARQIALSKQETTWLKRPIVGFAVAASFSALLLINYLPNDTSQQAPTPPQIANTTIDDTALDELLFLSNFDEIDMAVAEDLEFAYWLSEQLENDSSNETLSNGELRNG
jgi:hypothetical protein